MTVSQRIAFGEKPAGIEPLAVALARLVETERPEYRELLAQYQDKAKGLLAEYRIYENLGLLPIEEEFFYGQFLKALVGQPKQFDMRRLNLAAWIQEKGMDYFQKYCLGLGFPPQITPLFRWHYLFFDQVGEIIRLLENEELSPEDRENGLRAIGQQPHIAEVRAGARNLVAGRSVRS